MKQVFSFFTLIILGINCFAQQNQNVETAKFEICGNFKTPIIIPPKDYDTGIIVKPVSSFDSKIISENPCVEKKETLEFNFPKFPIFPNNNERPQ